MSKEDERPNRQLTALNDELRQINENLLATIEENANRLGLAVHDLKNPLFGIRALAEIVLETEDLSPDGKRRMSVIWESAAESLGLVEHLLDSAAERRTRQLEPQVVDLRAAAEWVARQFLPHAEQKEQRLECSVPEQPCRIYGDRRLVRAAIGNLVSNALKYAPRETLVDVVVDGSRDEAWVSVSDAGPGLSEADQERMFLPFQRVGPWPTASEHTSGLGLYIVKQIVELHEARIDVQTALGEGSTFHLIFPAIHPGDSSTGEGTAVHCETNAA